MFQSSSDEDLWMNLSSIAANFSLSLLQTVLSLEGIHVLSTKLEIDSNAVSIPRLHSFCRQMVSKQTPFSQKTVFDNQPRL